MILDDAKENKAREEAGRRESSGKGRFLWVFLWFAFWPVSELFGRPAEADEDIGWRRLSKLLGVALLVTVLVVAIATLMDYM